MNGWLFYLSCETGEGFVILLVSLATVPAGLYAYFLAFEDFRFGYAATVTWLMSLITGFIILTLYLLSRRSRYEGGY